MSDGVTDEQRVAAFRDTYGRVAFAAVKRELGHGPAEMRWEHLDTYGRIRFGNIAEVVIDAFVSGEVANALIPSGAVAVPVEELAALRERAERLIEFTDAAVEWARAKATAWRDEDFAEEFERVKRARAALQPGDRDPLPEQAP